MTIDIFVLKGDLNRENRSGAFLFLLGIHLVHCCYLTHPFFISFLFCNIEKIIPLYSVFQL